MSRFYTENLKNLKAYVPGEQPKDFEYIKLNTNEAPYHFEDIVGRSVSDTFEKISRYPDPECTALTEALSRFYQIDQSEIIPGNGSDENLNFIMKAFCDEKRPAIFPDITYGFYHVIADVNLVPWQTVPLREDLSIAVEDYEDLKGVLFIANPNAPTGLVLQPSEIETLLNQDLNRLVVVDEAYGEFGGESCIPLIKKYDNLIVVKTFSKAWGMAGGRLGFAAANRELICDMNTVRYSINPYNVNRMTMAAGCALIENSEKVMEKVAVIIKLRERFSEKLKALGFRMTDSKANFIFAEHPQISGGPLYQRLKAGHILVRHFSDDRITNFNRITVGSEEEMNALCIAVEDILKEFV